VPSLLRCADFSVNGSEDDGRWLGETVREPATPATPGL
jgi:hypothetical protein